jgi:hypothetical protein
MRTRAALPLALAMLAAALPLAAATSTVDDLLRLVRDAVQRQQSDGDLARVLHRVNLGQRLDNRTAEELESQAPGPESIAELERLRQVSRDRALPKTLPSFASPPEPTPDELRGVLDEARRKALAYTAGLPDFICTETVRRYEENLQWGRSTAMDTLTLQLTYFGHQEKYRLTAVNGREPGRTYEQVGGASSRGEFGSMLLDVFAPASRTALTWSNWTALRKRPAYVFSFRIEAKNSRYHLYTGWERRVGDSSTVGEHGLVYIDRETRDVMRVDSEADSIPIDFPIAGASRVLDYGLAEVGGRSFLLPLRARVRMTLRFRSLLERNELDFSGYRKFAGESSISFGDSIDEKPSPALPAGK